MPILSLLDTFDLIEMGYSISRFGDGELYLVYKKKGYNTHNYNEKLAMELKKIVEYHNPLSKHLVCLPNFLAGEGIYAGIKRTNKYQIVWRGSSADRSRRLKKLFKGNTAKLMDKAYGSSYLGRPDVFVTDYGIFFRAAMSAFSYRSIFTVGNHYITSTEPIQRFIDSANSKWIQHIVTPRKNAFNLYPWLLKTCTTVAKTTSNPLFLLSIGATAAILAYDLHKLGIHTVDIGNFFRVYESFLRGRLV